MEESGKTWIDYQSNEINLEWPSNEINLAQIIHWNFEI